MFRSPRSASSFDIAIDASQTDIYLETWPSGPGDARWISRRFNFTVNSGDQGGNVMGRFCGLVCKSCCRLIPGIHR